MLLNLLQISYRWFRSIPLPEAPAKIQLKRSCFAIKILQSAITMEREQIKTVQDQHFLMFSWKKKAKKPGEVTNVNLLNKYFISFRCSAPSFRIVALKWINFRLKWNKIIFLSLEAISFVLFRKKLLRFIVFKVIWWNFLLLVSTQLRSYVRWFLAKKALRTERRIQTNHFWPA